MSNPKIKLKEKNYISTNKVINKTREDFRNELFTYARSNFSDQISDFSDASIGGMLLDFASIVGESLAFYVEQQFNELDYETATSDYNLTNHLRKAGVRSNNVYPASVNVKFYVEVDVKQNTLEIMPEEEFLPIIRKGTTLSSSNGVSFMLEEDVDFTLSNEGYQITEIDPESDLPSKILIEKTGICTSGSVESESVDFEQDDSGSFLTYTLSNPDVTKIISVFDEEENEFYEVDFLSQSTIYSKEKGKFNTFFTVKPAPYRFIKEVDFNTSFTTLRFGNGQGRNIEDGILTNPEDVCLPIMGREYFSSESIDPKDLIKSDSLGVSPAGKTLTIRYKHGAGDDHNVSPGMIDEINNIIISFPNTNNPLGDEAIITRESISVYNEEQASGASSGMSIEEMRSQIPVILKQQSRIVTYEDLISRIYTMPTDFGKIHKAAIIDNEYTKLAKDLFIICKNDSNFYVNAGDSLKVNLSNFLNEYRLIGDTLNIVDAKVYNIGIFLKIKVKSNFSVESVISDVSSSIFELMRFETLEIGEGINVNNIVNIAINTSGVVSIETDYKSIIRSKSQIDNEDDVIYNNSIFSPIENYEEGIVYPPRGGIFELKYESLDIEIINS